MYYLSSDNILLIVTRLCGSFRMSKTFSLGTYQPKQIKQENDFSLTKYTSFFYVTFLRNNNTDVQNINQDEITFTCWTI